MRGSKRNKGFTLIEQIIAVAILFIVLAMVGGGVAAVFELNRHQGYLQNDQYNIRMALLNISREIRHGVDLVSATGNVLQFQNQNGETVTFTLVGGRLNRSIQGTSDTTVALPFYPAQLSDFRVERLDSQGRLYNPGREPYYPGNWIRISLVGDDGVELNVTLAIYRIIA